MVVWCTGLAGSGKTTLCQAILSFKKRNANDIVVLDGDIVREIFGQDLGYTAEDRFKQISRMQRLAKHLSNQGLIVLVAALYSTEELLAWNRQNIPEYFEVFVRASMVTLNTRDQKGLYSGARTGQIKNVVGIDIPWSEPTNPDLVVESGNETPNFWAQEVISRVPRLKRALGTPGESLEI